MTYEDTAFVPLPQGEHGPDHWIIAIGRDEGDGTIEPLTLVDDFYESAEYASDPAVLTRAVEDVLSNQRILGGYTVLGQRVVEARANGSIRFRIYSIVAVAETHYSFDKDDNFDAPCPVCGVGPIELKGHGGTCPNGHILPGL